jgi:hypothetical protein
MQQIWKRIAVGHSVGVVTKFGDTSNCWRSPECYQTGQAMTIRRLYLLTFRGDGAACAISVLVND